MEASAALFELASVSLACRDQDTLLKTVAARVGATVSARTVLVWTVMPDNGLVCRARWSDPGERINPEAGSVSEGILAEDCESGGTRRLSAKQISADDLSHLEESSRARVKSAVYVALPGAQEQWQGVLEVLGKRSGEFSADDQLFIEEASRLAGQALTNLVLNAMIHAYPEERRGSIDVEVHPADRDHVEVVVADDGCGMAPEAKRQAFDPFFTTRRNEGATGLGLHITHSILVDRLGGRIRLDSEPDVGTVVRFVLPRSAVD